MQYTARMNGWTEFITMQSLHNAVYREEEKEMYPACAKFGMGQIPWSPVAMGFLTRPVEAFNDTTRGDSMKEGVRCHAQFSLTMLTILDDGNTLVRDR